MKRKINYFCKLYVKGLYYGYVTTEEAIKVLKDTIEIQQMYTNKTGVIIYCGTITKNKAGYIEIVEVFTNIVGVYDKIRNNSKFKEHYYTVKRKRKDE